jgi:3-oxoacyl-[acyl-carrier protein] reductase
MEQGLSGVALVTGGGRGIGASIARELSAAGMRLAVTGRTGQQVEALASEVDGLALVGDVSEPGWMADAVERTESELGPVELLVANAGVIGPRDALTATDPSAWWRTFEVNVLGVMLSCLACLPGMTSRREGRIVVVGSGASYLPLPAGSGTAYGASKAAAGRFAELLAGEVDAQGVHVFLISPGMVRTEMTSIFPDDAPWTPPELAPRLVRVIASGRADALTGRYLHAEHDDVEALITRADEIVEDDLNAIRLRR